MSAAVSFFSPAHFPFLSSIFTFASVFHDSDPTSRRTRFKPSLGMKFALRSVELSVPLPSANFRGIPDPPTPSQFYGARRTEQKLQSSLSPLTPLSKEARNFPRYFSNGSFGGPSPAYLVAP